MEGIFAVEEPAPSESPEVSPQGSEEKPQLERKSLHQGMSYGMDEVYPGVFVGGDVSARDKPLLLSHGITHILNAAFPECSAYHPSDFTYLSHNLKDTNSETIESLFYESVIFIDSALEAGGKVLVHCEMGMSRSVSLCLAYILFKTGETFEVAFEAMKQKRSISAPNMGFQTQLMDWQRRLQGQFPYPRLYAASTHHPKRSAKAVLRLVRNTKDGVRLDPRGVFLVHTQETVYIWTGAEVNSQAEPIYKDAALQYASYLHTHEQAASPPTLIHQSDEPSQFWSDLYPRTPCPSPPYHTEATWDRWYAMPAKPPSSRGDLSEKVSIAVYAYPEILATRHTDEMTETSLVCICTADSFFVWQGKDFEADTFSTEEYVEIVRHQYWDPPAPVIAAVLVQHGEEIPELQAVLAQLQSPGY